MAPSFRTVHAAALLAAAGIGASSSAQIQFQDQTSTRFPVISPAEYTNQCSIVDLDNDGDLDIVWANGQGFGAPPGAALKLRVFINSGTGTFTDESNARVGTGNPPVAISGWFRGVEFGDCDRDGDEDMILAQDFVRRPQLLINNGLGFFTNETTTRLPNVNLSSARGQFGDVDNDGDLDLFFNNSGSPDRFGNNGTPQLYINDGSGTYTDATVAKIPGGNAPPGYIPDQQDCVFGDVDSDFDLDVHVASRDSVSKLYLNDGTGKFANLAGFPGGANAYSYDFGDMDGDGDLDLLGANGVAETLLRNNHPTPAWTVLTSPPNAEISPNTVIDDNDSKWFDFDNDGDLDFIIGSLGSIERIYRNNGQVAGADFTQVTPAIITANSDATMDIKVADLTGDGKLDIITAQGEAMPYTDRIYVNIGGPGVVDNRPPRIIRTEQVADAVSDANPFVVRTVIYDDYTSDRGFHDRGVFLNYTVDGAAQKPIAMDWSGNSLWRGAMSITGSALVEYWITALDFNNNLATGPTLSFTIDLPCPADVDGSGGVNVTDLLSVIAAWGPCVDPCPPTPQTCPEDVNGDCVVNVQDLLGVIAQWGACP